MIQGLTAGLRGASLCGFIFGGSSRTRLLRPLQIPHSAPAHTRAQSTLRGARRTPVKLNVDMEARIAIVGPYTAPYFSELKHLPPEAKVVVQGNSLEEFEGKEEELSDANVVVVAPPAGRPLVSALWPKLKNVKWVHCIFAGVDHLLFPELVDAPIPVTNAKGLFSSSLAEYSILAMSYFAKDVPRLTRQKADAKWEKFDVKELRGSTLGIIGYGDIGSSCARLAKAFGMRIVALRRRPGKNPDGIADKELGTDKVNELMAESDYVVLAAALTPDTRGIVSEEALSHSKEGQVIINLGRGPLVDEAALVKALQDGRLKGAALDVFDKEPLPDDNPLWKLDNVLISPHNMDQTEDFLYRSVKFFTENAVRYCRGMALQNLIDKRAGY